MRIPAALLAFLLSVQPGGSAFAQAAAARSAAVPVSAPVATTVLPLVVSPATLPRVLPLSAVGPAPSLSATAALTLPAPAGSLAVGPVASVRTAESRAVSKELAAAQGHAERLEAPAPAAAAPSAPVLAARTAELRDEVLGGAAGRVRSRLADARHFLGGRAAEEEPAGTVRKSGLARFYGHLTHFRAGRALKPAGDGVPPGEKEGKERERAKALAKVVGIGLAFGAIETIGAWFTGSVALRADAMHLALDTSVSAAALLALWLSRRARNSENPRRFAKAEPVIGLVSSAAIGFTAIEIGLEVFDRFMAPVVVPGPTTMLLALSGLAANVINALILRRFQDDGLSMKGAFLHALTDAVGSIGIIASGLAVYYWQWAWADAAIGGVIVALILGTAVNLARTSWRALKAPAPPK